MVQKILSYLAARPLLAAWLVAAHAALTWPTHDLVQDVVRAVQNWLGPALFSGLAIAILAASAVAAVVWAARNRGWAEIDRHWAVVFLSMLLAWRITVAAESEAAHFVQYAVVAVPVFALCRRYFDTVVWVGLLGVADEWLQYAWLHRSWRIYFDFNDVALNLIGAYLGVLLVRAAGGDRFAAPLRRSALSVVAKSPAYRAAIVIGLLLVVGWVVGVVGLFPEDGSAPIMLSRQERRPTWIRPPWSGKDFHVLRPWTGLLVALLLPLPAAALDAKREVDESKLRGRPAP
jgi:hypothetical protein